MSGALELRGTTSALLDEPLAVSVRGLGDAAGAQVTWRARLRDDDGRVWRATAADPLALAAAWTPGADASGRAARAVAALQSLHPLALEVRAEAGDGRAAARTFTRLLLAKGVRVRRWKQPLAATLFLPSERLAENAVLLDATDAASGSAPALVAPLAAALLASRGVVALVVPAGRGRDAGAALPLLAEVARGEVEIVPPPLPPGVPGLAEADADAWDALLARLGALARTPVERPQAADGLGGAGSSGASAASSTARPSGDSS